jgi:hypothetical protein
MFVVGSREFFGSQGTLRVKMHEHRVDRRSPGQAQERPEEVTREQDSGVSAATIRRFSLGSLMIDKPSFK